MKRIFHSYAFDTEKALKTGDFGTSNFTQIIDYDYFIINPRVEDYPMKRISEIDEIEDFTDYYDDLGNYIIYFVRNNSDKKPHKVLLKKNKIYKFNKSFQTLDYTLVTVEYGDKYNICDTCYETYLFIKEEDIEIARKQICLNKKLKKIKRT